MADPLTSLPGYVLRRASAGSIVTLNQGLSPLGLRHTDVSLLLLIERNPGITQSEAGRLLDIQRANMVPLVARLESRALVNRRRANGRSQGLYLSVDGVALLTKGKHVIEVHERALVERVPEALRPHVLPILTALWIGER